MLTKFQENAYLWVLKSTRSKTKRMPLESILFSLIFTLFAEGEGFKPPIPRRVYRISSPARSFTLPTFPRKSGAKVTLFLRISKYILFFSWPTARFSENLLDVTNIICTFAGEIIISLFPFVKQAVYGDTLLSQSPYQEHL